MKYPSTLYAKALAEVIAESTSGDSAAWAKNFVATIRNNGDEAQLPKILEEAERLVRRHDGTHAVTFESARMPSDAQRKEMHSLIGAGDAVREKTNPALIAGVRIIVDDERQFDGSMRGKLEKLFGGS